MARPIKLLEATEPVLRELRRRVKASTSTCRDRFPIEIILLRLNRLRMADVAARCGHLCRRCHYGPAVLNGLPCCTDRKGCSRA